MVFLVFLVFSRQHFKKRIEEILFREVLRRSLGSLGGARFFQHVNNNVQFVRGAWRDREGGERHQYKVLKFGTTSSFKWQMASGKWQPGVAGGRGSVVVKNGRWQSRGGSSVAVWRASGKKWQVEWSVWRLERLEVGGEE